MPRQNATKKNPSPPPPLRRRRSLLQLAAFLLAAIAVAGYLHLQSPNLPETDAFYHVHHASLYVRHGLFMSEFPWVIASVIHKYSADIWYGFHLLLIPFTFIHDPIMQLKVAGVFLLTVALLLFFISARRAGLAFPYLWPFLWLFSSGLVTRRLAMLRPHVLSVGLMTLLFSFMLEGGIYGVFLISAATTFIHLSFFWLPVLVAFVVAAVKLAVERKFEWRKLLAMLAGLTAGWLLRPNPIGALKILNTQVFQLMSLKQSGQLRFARELYPVDPVSLFHTTPALLIIWLCFILVFLISVSLRRPKLALSNRTFLWASFALSVIFFAMTVFMSMRSIDLWAPFALLFSAAGFDTFLLSKRAPHQQFLPATMRKVLTPVLLVILAGMIWISLSWYRGFMFKAIEPQRLRAAGEWLKENTKPEAIVMNLDTDAYVELSFWGADNRFVLGMDTIFTYAYDPTLFFKIANLMSARAPGYTWDTIYFDESRLTDAYTFLRRDLGASYIVMRTKYYPPLYDWAKNDPRFKLRFDREGIAIFQLAE